MSAPIQSPSATAAAPPFDRSRAMSAVLAQNWWAIALRGAFAILFGVLTFLTPGVTITTLVILFSAYMTVDGVCAIVAGVKAAGRHERWGLLILEGVANIVTGLVALFLPALTVIVFVYLVAGWSIVSGLFMTVAAFKLDLDHGRWLLALAGIVSVVFGILLAIAPLAAAVVLTLWLGAYALVFGATLLMLSFKLRQRRADSSPTGGPAFAGR